MSRVTLASSLGAICIASLSLALPLTPALAQTGATSQTSEVLIEVPTVLSVNSSLDDAAIRVLISDVLIGHELELTGWNADSVTVPLVKVTYPPTTKKGKPTLVTYTDMILTNVQAGSAQTLSIGAVAADLPQGSYQLDLARFENVNLANIARVTSPSTLEEDNFYPLYSALSIEGASLFAGDTECNAGAFTSTNFTMRPIGSAIATFKDMATDPDWLSDGDFVRISPFLTSSVQFLTAVRTGPASLNGLDCTTGGNDEIGPTLFGIGSTTIAGMEPGIYPQIETNTVYTRLNDENRVSLATLTIKPIDATHFLEAIDAAPKPLTEEWLEQNTLNLRPNFGGLSFTGLDVFFGEDEDPPIALTVGEFDISLPHHIHATPSALDAWAKHIVFNVPEDDDNELFSLMRGAGVTKIDGGFRIAGKWIEDSETIEIEEASVDIDRLSLVKLDALLSNASKALFSDDSALSLQASSALALQTLNLAIEDKGLSDIVLAAVSGEIGADTEAMRPIYAELAKGSIIAYLTDLAEAASLGDAVSQFISGAAKTLTIGIDAKSEKGIALDAFEAAEDDPAAILSQIHVTAKAK